MPSSSTTDKPLQILVSGAGIAGTILAYWLAKDGGAQVTVLERADALRREGQTVDVRAEGLQVIQRMGLEEVVRSKTTHEKGFQFIDARGKIWGTLPENGDASFTSDIEISRGELAMCLYDKCKDMPGVQFRYSETITSIRETPDAVQVTFSRDGKQREYDMLLIAEGLNSYTRAMAFNEDKRAGIRAINLWTAGFSLPSSPDDSEYATYFNAPGRRGVLVRPDGKGRTSVSLGVFSEGARTEELRTINSSKTSVAAQKAYFKDLFKDMQWKVPRFLKALDSADDFYLQEIGQSIRSSWSTGRVALVGDTAYCPSAITGKGTTVAIAGAYVLASKILQHRHAPDGHRVAFTSYEKELRPWIEEIQQFPSWGPYLFNPATETGIYIRNCIAFAITSFIQLPVVSWAVGKFLIGAEKTYRLPTDQEFGKA